VLLPDLESRRIEGYAWRGVEKLLLRLLPTWLLGPILLGFLRLYVVAEAEVGVVGQMGLLYQNHLHCEHCKDWPCCPADLSPVRMLLVGQPEERME